MKRAFFIVMVIVLAGGCTSNQPKPIAYGSDLCSFCQMMVTDKKFGSELVTDKGRYYFFDSSECMLRYMSENEETHFAHILVTHFGAPDVLADAKTSFYVVSKEIPSPMGANLSAYPNRETAEEIAAAHNGKIYSFEELAKLYRVVLHAAN